MCSQNNYSINIFWLQKNMYDILNTLANLSVSDVHRYIALPFAFTLASVSIFLNICRKRIQFQLNALTNSFMLAFMLVKLDSKWRKRVLNLMSCKLRMCSCQKVTFPDSIFFSFSDNIRRSPIQANLSSYFLSTIKKIYHCRTMTLPKLIFYLD